MSLDGVLSSQTVLSLVAAAVGGIWTAFRATDWCRGLRARRYFKALRALEAGVELTYRTYVKAIKAARADGKLTEKEKQEARRRAREAALEFGRTKGIDVLRELGAEYIDLLIAKYVKQMKRK